MTQLNQTFVLIIYVIKLFILTKSSDMKMRVPQVERRLNARLAHSTFVVTLHQDRDLLHSLQVNLC